MIEMEDDMIGEHEIKLQSKLDKLTELAWDMAYRLKPDPDKVSLPLGLSDWERKIKDILEDSE
jgi:hypothetical protein